MQTVSRSYRQRFDSKHGNVALHDAFIEADNNQSYPEAPQKLHELPALYLQKEVWSVPLPVDTNLRWIISTKEPCS